MDAFNSLLTLRPGLSDQSISHAAFSLLTLPITTLDRPTSDTALGEKFVMLQNNSLRKKKSKKKKEKSAEQWKQGGSRQKNTGHLEVDLPSGP